MDATDFPPAKRLDTRPWRGTRVPTDLTSADRGCTRCWRWLLTTAMIVLPLVTAIGAELFTSIPGAVYDVDKTRDLRLFGIKQDWLIQSSPSLLWQLGFDLRRQRADYSLHSLVWRDPNDPSEDPLGLYPVETVGQGEESGTLVSAYSASRLRLFGPATVEAGLRYDRASHTHDSDLSPRLSAMVDLSRGVLLRLGWGQYRQMHDIHDEIALNAGGHYDPSELSTQWTGGIERVFCGGTAVRVEAYHKHTDNPRPVYRNWVAGSRCAVATPSPWPANACAASTTSTSPTPPSASPPKTTPRAISATPSVSI